MSNDSKENTIINLRKIEPFDTTKHSYNVLLFPFQPLEKCLYKKTDIELTIITRLREMNDKDNLNLQIKFDTVDCVRSSNEADSLGKKLNANLVIWGDLYEHCTTDNEACLKFVNISPVVYIPKQEMEGESGIEKMTSLSEVGGGKLQRDIDFIIYWVAASRAFYEGDYVTALSHSKRIEKSGKITVELLSLISACYYALQFFEQTKIYLEAALKIDPNLYPLNSFYAFLLETHFNDLGKAQVYYKKSLMINPNDASLNCQYANFLQLKLHDWQEARIYYEKGLKIDSNNVLIHRNYAALLSEHLNDIKGAREHLEKALRLAPNDIGVYVNYSTLLESNYGDFNGAKLILEKALTIDPNNIQALTNYATLISFANDRVNAKAYFEKALNIDPNNASALSGYASILANDPFNDFDRAKDNYEKAIAIEPNNGNIYVSYAYFLKNKLRNSVEAKKQYRKAILIDPTIRNESRDKLFN